MQAQRVVIIGGGFSGSMAAYHLLKQSTRPLDIVMLERHPEQLHGGVAYSASTASKEHRTNIGIGRMSALEDKSEHLRNWLDANGFEQLGNNQGMPRTLYQAYLSDLVRGAVYGAHEDVTLRKEFGEAVAINKADWGFNISLADHPRMVMPTNYVVLATGFPAAKTAPFMHDILQSDAFIADQFSPEGRQKLAAIDPNDSVFIVGAGLSGYDVVVSLITQGHEGKIIMASREAHTHKPYPLAGVPQVDNRELDRLIDARVREFSSSFRSDDAATIASEIRRAVWELTALEGFPLEAVLASSERLIPNIVSRIGDEIVQTLLRQYNSLIVTHRVGVQPEIARIIEQAKGEGQLEIIATSIKGMEERKKGGIKIQHRIKGATADNTTLKVDRVISCLGRNTVDHPLWEQLFSEDMAVGHFTGHGIQVDSEGELVDESGDSVGGIYAVGPIRAGDSFQVEGRLPPTTGSVPGIRRHIEQTMGNLISNLRYGDVGTLPDAFYVSEASTREQSRAIAVPATFPSRPASRSASASWIDRRIG